VSTFKTKMGAPINFSRWALSLLVVVPLVGASLSIGQQIHSPPPLMGHPAPALDAEGQRRTTEERHLDIIEKLIDVATRLPSF